MPIETLPGGRRYDTVKRIFIDEPIEGRSSTNESIEARSSTRQRIYIPRNTIRRNIWERINDFVTNIGDWFENNVSTSSSFVSMIFYYGAWIILAISVIYQWINSGLWSAILTAIIGSIIVYFVAGIGTVILIYVIVGIFWILRYVFYNIYILLLTISIITGVCVFNSSNFFHFYNKTKIEQMTTPALSLNNYYCNAQTSLNVRESTNEKSKIIGQLKRNEECYVVNYYQSSGFAEIDFNGKKGYVNATYLRPKIANSPDNIIPESVFLKPSERQEAAPQNPQNNTTLQQQESTSQPSDNNITKQTLEAEKKAFDAADEEKAGNESEITEQRKEEKKIEAEKRKEQERIQAARQKRKADLKRSLVIYTFDNETDANTQNLIYDTPSGEGNALIFDKKNKPRSFSVKYFRGEKAISLWIKDCSSGTIWSLTQKPLLDREKAYDSPYLNYNASNNSIQYRYKGTNNQMNGVSAENNYYTIAFNNCNLNDGKWHLLTLCVVENCIRIYLDGLLLGQSKSSNDWRMFPNEQNLPAITVGGANMKIDNLRIYSDKLTQEDIVEIYEEEMGK